jgi:hypothetical protein
LVQAVDIEIGIEPKVDIISGALKIILLLDNN